jgi:hypothetical protein
MMITASLPARHRGRPPGIPLTQEHRDKIKASWVRRKAAGFVPESTLPQPVRVAAVRVWPEKVRKPATSRRARRRPALSKSFVFYAGPSMLDGAPILGIATGLKQRPGLASENPKTVGMVQTWIVRAHREPHEALSGEDESVCGRCPMRPLLVKAARKAGEDRPYCYVRNSKSWPGLINIFRSWKMGNIPTLTLEEAAQRLEGRLVRLGAYGDPAALPLAVWEELLSRAAGSIGYTHQWRNPIVDPGFARWVMASVESPAWRDAANRAGYRTYRVDMARDGVKLEGEARCPGSKEMGHKLTCASCLACNGTATGRRADIVIQAH